MLPPRLGYPLSLKTANLGNPGSIVVQYKDQKQLNSEPRVRVFYGLVVSKGVNRGVFVTSASFTAPTQKFAQGKRLEVIDGSALAELGRPRA